MGEPRLVCAASKDILRVSMTTAAWTWRASAGRTGRSSAAITRMSGTGMGGRGAGGPRDGFHDLYDVPQAQVLRSADLYHGAA